MQKIFLGIVVIVGLLVVGFFALNSYIYNEKQADEEVLVREEDDVANYSTITDREAGFSFEYKTSPDGYVVEDTTENPGEVPDDTMPLRVYTVINAREKAELEASEPGREGPPAMQLAIYQNDNNQSASTWVDTFEAQSNINLVTGEVNRDAVVGGANAVRYTTDGLYMSENAVVAHGDFVYHFSGSYLENDSVMHQDFKALVDSIAFIANNTKPAAPSAKIDVRVACQSALAYMLFESSEQSDQFIEACIAGEHPDVIERYIESLGLDGATI